MGVHGGPDIVTDGLHYAMDPANKQSYVEGSSAGVSSIAGPVPTGTLGASNTFSSDNGGILNFDGGSDYIEVAPNGINAGFNVQNWTLCSFSNYNGVGYGPLWSFDYTAHSSPYYVQHIRYNHSKQMLWYWEGFNGLTYTSGTEISNVWNFFAFVRDYSNSSAYTYYKGPAESNDIPTVVASTTSNTAQATYVNQEVWIGNVNWGTKLTGKIGPQLFYTKALSQAEITQVFNAYRERFGL